MRLLLGILMGMAVMAVDANAYRMRRPPTFYEWNTNTFTDLNNALAEIHNISNGRYQLDVVTVDPDGVRPGDVGEMVYFDSGTDQLCVNSTGAKVWVCVNLS